MEDTRNVRFRVVQISTSFFLVSLFTGALACLSSLCYAGDVEELTLTPEQLKEYRKSYSMPEVRTIPKISRYLRRFETRSIRTRNEQHGILTRETWTRG